MHLRDGYYFVTAFTIGVEGLDSIQWIYCTHHLWNSSDFSEILTFLGILFLRLCLFAPVPVYSFICLFCSWKQNFLFSQERIILKYFICSEDDVTVTMYTFAYGSQSSRQSSSVTPEKSLSKLNVISDTLRKALEETDEQK